MQEAIAVREFLEPPLRPLFGLDGRRPPVPMEELITDTDQRLGVPMPPWLRTVYQNCNGFVSASGECVLYPLHGSEGVAEFTLFLREQEWAPPWMARAIVFGHLGGSGSSTTHSVALDGQLAEWCYNDGDQFTVLEGDLFDLWRRVQVQADSMTEE